MGNLERLDELIPHYGKSKTSLDEYKKICDADNQEIKKIMNDLVLSHYTAGGYKVTRSVSERESLDEDILLEVLKDIPEVKENNIIKSKDYVDMDALERALYSNLLPSNVLLEMDKARSTKVVTTLKISKVKKKKED